MVDPAFGKRVQEIKAMFSGSDLEDELDSLDFDKDTIFWSIDAEGNKSMNWWIDQLEKRELGFSVEILQSDTPWVFSKSLLDLYKTEGYDPKADYWIPVEGSHIPMTGTRGEGTPHAVPKELGKYIKPGKTGQKKKIDKDVAREHGTDIKPEEKERQKDQTKEGEKAKLKEAAENLDELKKEAIKAALEGDGEKASEISKEAKELENHVTDMKFEGKEKDKLEQRVNDLQEKVDSLSKEKEGEADKGA